MNPNDSNLQSNNEITNNQPLTNPVVNSQPIDQQAQNIPDVQLSNTPIVQQSINNQVPKKKSILVPVIIVVIVVALIGGGAGLLIHNYLSNSSIPNNNTNNNKGAFLMGVEDVYRITGRGTVVTGTIERGSININDEIEIVGLRATQTTVVTGIEIEQKKYDSAKAGDYVGIEMKDLAYDDIERGQVLAKPGSITAHHQFKAHINLLSREEGGLITPLADKSTSIISLRCSKTPGVITLKGNSMKPGTQGNVEIKLNDTVALEKGDQFTIIDIDQTLGNKTIGQGTITKIIE